MVFAEHTGFETHSGFQICISTFHLVLCQFAPSLCLLVPRKGLRPMETGIKKVKKACHFTCKVFVELDWTGQYRSHYGSIVKSPETQDWGLENEEETRLFWVPLRLSGGRPDLDHPVGEGVHPAVFPATTTTGGQRAIWALRKITPVLKIQFYQKTAKIKSVEFSLNSLQYHT